MESLDVLASTYNLYLTPSSASYNRTHPEWPHNTYTQYEAKFLSANRKAQDLFITGAIFII